MEKYSPEQDQLFKIPTATETAALDEEGAALLRTQYMLEFEESMDQLNNVEIHPREREALVGSLIIKHGLKLSTTYRIPTHFGAGAFLYKLYGPEKYQITLAGLVGERGFAKTATDMGAGIYLTSDILDVRYGVDCIADVSQIGNEDFVTADTKHLPPELQEYNHLAVSIKSSVDIPLTEEFELLYPCRSAQEILTKLEGAKRAFYQYYEHDRQETLARIDQRWDHIVELCMTATQSMSGYDRNGKLKDLPLAERYNNVLPVVFLMPSINDYNCRAYEEGLPNPALTQQILVSLMSEIKEYSLQ